MKNPRAQKTFTPGFLDGYQNSDLERLTFEEISKIIGQELRRVRGDDLKSSVEKTNQIPTRIRLINLDFGRSQRSDKN